MGRPFSQQRESEACGSVNVTIFPDEHTRECGDTKLACHVKVIRDGEVVWAPTTPMCLGVTTNMTTPEGRARTFATALAFFEHHRCGRTLFDGAKGKQRTRRRRKPSCGCKG